VRGGVVAVRIVDTERAEHLDPPPSHLGHLSIEPHARRVTGRPLAAVDR